MKENSKNFRHYLTGRYGTYVCFQQSYRPTGSMIEGRPLHFGNQKLHCYKFESSVLAKGFCNSCSKHARWGRSDLEVLQCRKKFHKYATTKRGDVESLEDVGQAVDDHETLFAILVDKGYKEIKEILR